MRKRSQFGKRFLKSKSEEFAKVAVLVQDFSGTVINGDKMKRLVPNAVPITSNYEEITLWEEIIKISNDDTITRENLLVLKTNIEMRLGSKLQEMGWDLGNGKNKLLYLSCKCLPRVSL
jgi:hypothetical protein